VPEIPKRKDPLEIGKKRYSLFALRRRKGERKWAAGLEGGEALFQGRGRERKSCLGKKKDTSRYPRKNKEGKNQLVVVKLTTGDMGERKSGGRDRQGGGERSPSIAGSYLNCVAWGNYNRGKKNIA